MFDVPDAVRRAPAALLHIDRVQLALDIVAPELEELVELGKIGREVEFLPDETLQQGGVVRQPVDDLRRGEPIPPDLQLIRGHVRASLSHFAPRIRASRHAGSGAIEKCKGKQRISSRFPSLLPRPGRGSAEVLGGGVP
jgi:hypothetical protein